MIREPAVAGRFYPGSAGQLQAEVDSMLAVDVAPRQALLAVCPHAGYIFSGATTGKVLGRVVVPRRVALLGPSHQGVGKPVALMSRGQWKTPLGLVELDERLGDLLKKHGPFIEEDETAHKFEHSLEVIVPFLQRRQPDLLLSPICLMGIGAEDCLTVGGAIAGAIKELGEPALIVASTDMSHYISADKARQLDGLAIERVLELDPMGLHRTVIGQGITMCGVVPTAVGLAAAKELGAAKAELVDYTHSGKVTGDDQEVVAYAGMIVS